MAVELLNTPMTDKNNLPKISAFTENTDRFCITPFGEIGLRNWFNTVKAKV